MIREVCHSSIVVMLGVFIQEGTRTDVITGCLAITRPRELRAMAYMGNSIRAY